jgi:hypothetical protein
MYQLTKAVVELFESKKYYTVTFFTKSDAEDLRKNERTFKIEQKEIYKFLAENGVTEFVDPTRLRQTNGRRREVKEVKFTPGFGVTLNVGGKATLKNDVITSTYDYVNVK